jgi:4-nitrophenyl phosphatase
MPDAKIAGVVLAAGGSRRYGQPKQLLDWDGRPLVTHIADTAWTAGLSPVVVVVGAEAEKVIPLLASRPVRIVRNYRWQEGMSTSLYAGLAALDPEVEGALFMPIDQPLITRRLLQRIVRTYEETGAGIVVPEASQGRRGTSARRGTPAQRGTPALFTREFFPELATLSGDVGGRALFEQHADRIVSVPVQDPRVLTDVDTPEAYQTLRGQAGASGVDLSAVRGIICDMDGVLWRGDTALPGLGDFFDLLNDLKLNYVLVTNNSSRTPDQYVRKLAGMGVETTVDHVLNSAIAAAGYVAGVYPGATVYAIGGPGVREALEHHGLGHRDALDVAEVDVVVVGWDRQLNWRKLATATRLILDGAAFVGTNPDLTFPMENTLAPGNGAQTAALEAATGVTPVIAGKPAPLLYRQAMDRMGTTPETTLVIGDRLDTDILGGLRLGMPTAMVLTGVSPREELEASQIRPDAVFENLPALVGAWREAAR